MTIHIRTMVAIIAVSALARTAHAQSLSYNSGQPVAPAYEGWEEGTDGVKYFLFGYMNRNWEEDLNVAVGAENAFSPGPADRGQPTHFLPRRNRFVFKVRVPDNFTEKDELVWTLTTHRSTEKAYASLRVDYKVDDVVKASETGALGAGSSSPEIRANKPPVVTVEGAKTRTVNVGEPLTLMAVVADDGVPKSKLARQLAALTSRSATVAGGEGGASPAAAPPEPARRNPFLLPPTRITVGKNVGLHLSWYVYRGEGKVTFAPDQIKPWEDTRAGANSPWAPLWIPPTLPADGRITTTATFAQPGTYVLRALADDGALLGSEDVTVLVR
ncbi:MAG TPA: hypothetical protein VF456_10605 [Vicinamibacterales bacterium]